MSTRCYKFSLSLDAWDMDVNAYHYRRMLRTGKHRISVAAAAVADAHHETC